MTRFRPCIDLHEGKVKQIVGGTLKDNPSDGPRTNYETDLPASHFAGLYRTDELRGGHVVKLGPGNEAAARDALKAWPGGLQLGGGVRRENAAQWLEAGASHVIVTSWLFDESGAFDETRLEQLVGEIGKEKLVIDLSCRRDSGGWHVAMNRWQTPTQLRIDRQTLHGLGGQCAEFLVHAADVEGRCEGIDSELVAFLGQQVSIPVTYAGGARSIDDLKRVEELSAGRVDLTIGSALDIFGGSGARYADCVAWNRRSGEG